jgi:hypothetical protein
MSDDKGGGGSRLNHRRRGHGRQPCLTRQDIITYHFRTTQSSSLGTSSRSGSARRSNEHSTRKRFLRGRTRRDGVRSPATRQHRHLMLFPASRGGKTRCTAIGGSMPHSHPARLRGSRLHKVSARTAACSSAPLRNVRNHLHEVHQTVHSLVRVQPGERL